MKLILVRHPETEANVQHIIYGRLDSHYSERGFRTAAQTAEILKEKKIDKVYTSPLWRASWLAEKIAEDHGLTVTAKGGEVLSDSIAKEGEIIPDVVRDDRLMELNFGLFEGKTNAEAKEIYGDGFSKFWSDLANFTAPEGESWTDVQNRVVEFMKEVLAPEIEGQTEGSWGWSPLTMRRPGEACSDTICIVAHALVIRAAMAWFLKMPLNDSWGIEIRTGGYIEMIFDSERPRMFGLAAPTV